MKEKVQSNQAFGLNMPVKIGTKNPFKKFYDAYISKRSVSEIITFTIVWFIFLCFAASYAYILFWGFMSGFKTHDEIAIHPFALPTKLHWENYATVFTKFKIAGYGFFGMFLNSVYFSVLGQFITCMVTIMLAYATAKFKFFGSKFFYYAVMVMINLPLYGGGGSTYKLLYNLGFINSYSQILLAFGGMNMNYLIFYSAFKSLSWTYAEAAYIDGANDFTVFFRIMLPQMMSVFGAIYLTLWVADWNNFSGALIYLTKKPVLASGIYSFELNMKYEARLDILYAAYMITAIPPLLLFAFFNKALTSNISLGGIKE